MMRMAKQGVDPVSRLVVGFLRLFSNKKQSDFADASGIYQADVSRYESGDKAPIEKTLRRLATAAGVPWFAVPHLRRFFGGVVNAAREGSGSGQLGEVRLEPAILEPAFLAAAAYWIEDEFPAATPSQLREKLIREAEQTWETLERFPVYRRRHITDLLPQRCRSWALAVRACAASLKAAADKPADALELAALALALAEQLPSDSFGIGKELGRLKLQGYCWGHLANARRVATDFNGAQEGFTRAWQLWRAGGSDNPAILPEWFLFSLEASLRLEQRRFLDALELLDCATALCGGEPAAMARLLLQKEHNHEARGDIASALAALAQAAPFVEAAEDRHLLLAFRFKTANNLYHLQRFTEAADLLPEIDELAVEQGADLDRLRVVWLAARIAAGLGQRVEAMGGLKQVSQRFTDLELPYEAGLSSLDLAVLWLEEGRTAEVRDLAVAMAWIFNAKGIQREALAALRIFRESVERDIATVELARRAIAEIEALRRVASPQTA